MSTKYLVVVVAMAAMLVAATALGTDSAFADQNRKHDGKGGYENSQAVSQANDFGNGEIPDSVDLTTEPTEPIQVCCQNLASQIRGDDNNATLSGEQGVQEAE